MNGLSTAVPSLSVVIPVYNEPDWIVRCVEALSAAVARSPFESNAELVIVDDGSAAPTREALRRLPGTLPTRVIEQENKGRLEARRAGIENASKDVVLLLDSRVILAPDALRFVGSKMKDDGIQPWNAHVDIDVRRNPFARFWRTVTYVAWRDYLENPRTTSFGLEEFDRYPKGTTCFMAPRALLLRALREFRSMYADTRHSNDDTILIRSLAEETPINISPSFACSYVSRDSLRGFLRHSFHRGTVFLDAFGRPGTRFFPFVVGFFPASLLFAWLALRRPGAALALGLSGPLAATLGAAALRRPPADVVAFGALSGPFTVAYGAGIWRGAIMAARAALSQ
jgi:glycosyltransferase involved in cell wall biosynthesis